MDDPILFWTKWSAIGQIAGAIATFGAVVASLWIARSERRAYIRVQAGLRITFDGEGGPAEDLIAIRITNHGLRPVRISSVGWRTGWLRFGPKWLKFQFAMQMFQLPVANITSPQPPFDLGPGQETSLYLSPETFRSRSPLRDEFFNRKRPFGKTIRPTKICVTVSLVASNAVHQRVEKTLEHFLATGEIKKGAEEANKEIAKK